MKYVALLRGINVGGNTLISMSTLKEAFEALGYTNVRTYINSGNVLFTTDEKDITTLTRTIETMLITRFHYPVTVIIKSHAQMKQILKEVPNDWYTNNTIRCYVAYVKNSRNADEIAKQIAVKDGVDILTPGPGVLYMTSVLTSLTKSAFNKLAGQKIYKEMTIRNFNTTRKIGELLEKEH